MEVKSVKNVNQDRVPIETTEVVERKTLSPHLGNIIDFYI